jgi:hypothetical protein
MAQQDIPNTGFQNGTAPDGTTSQERDAVLVNLASYQE